MPHYELIYETGRHSIANYANDEEAASAAREHQRRATSGELGTPASVPRSDLSPQDMALAGQTQWPAERVARILVYDSHPADYMAGQEMAAEDVTNQVSSLIQALEKDGTVSVPELTAQVRNLTNPQVAGRESPHDSNYKMESTSEVPADAWATPTA